MVEAVRGGTLNSFYVPVRQTTITSFVEAVSTALGMTERAKKLPVLLRNYLSCFRNCHELIATMMNAIAASASNCG
jgi:hypothetical protein